MRNSFLFIFLALLTTACGTWNTKLVGEDYDTKGGEVKWPTGVHNAQKYETEAYDMAKNYCSGDYKVTAKRYNREDESFFILLESSVNYEYIHFKCAEGSNAKTASKN